MQALPVIQILLSNVNTKVQTISNDEVRTRVQNKLYDLIECVDSAIVHDETFKDQQDELNDKTTLEN